MWVLIMRTPNVKKAMEDANKQLRRSTWMKNQTQKSCSTSAHHYTNIANVAESQEPESPEDTMNDLNWTDTERGDKYTT